MLAVNVSVFDWCSNELDPYCPLQIASSFLLMTF